MLPAVSSSRRRAVVWSWKCDRSDETTTMVSGPPQTRATASETRDGGASPISSGTIAPPGTTRWMRSAEHTSELQALMPISYVAFGLQHNEPQRYAPRRKANVHAIVLGSHTD